MKVKALRFYQSIYHILNIKQKHALNTINPYTPTKEYGDFFDYNLFGVKLYIITKIKMSELERFAHMFDKSIGLVKPNREFLLRKVA